MLLCGADTSVRHTLVYGKVKAITESPAVVS
jgi:hypothetical protein